MTAELSAQCSSTALKFTMVDSASCQIQADCTSYLSSTCKNGTLHIQASPEFLLLLMSESCNVCASVLRPNMPSVLSSQA